MVLAASAALASPLNHPVRHAHGPEKRDMVATVYVTQVVTNYAGADTAAQAVETSAASAAEVSDAAETTTTAGVQSQQASASSSSAVLAVSSFSTVYSQASSATQSTAAAESSSSSASASVAASSSSAAESSSTSASVSVESSSSSTASSSSSTSTSGISGVPEAITYSPYNDDSSCKDADSVYSDLSSIASKGISTVRIYGTDCDSIPNVASAAIKLGLTINQGFYISSSGADSVDDGVQTLISWVQDSNSNDWSVFTTFTVGNEAVYNGYTTGATLLAKVKSVKALLVAAGWTGTITTAETSSTYIAYPDLCTDTDGVDYVSLNAHPYFDTSASADTAGDFILDQISTIKSTCNSRTVYISETGYPSAGDTNGNNVPTPANQKIAIAKLMSALDGKGTFFTCYDDKWKSAGSFNVEQHFGILDLF